MAFTVNTNTGAMAALQSLNQTNRGMSMVQSRINTGLNVASTKDDSAKFVIAQKLRGDMAGFQAVTSSLNNAKSVTDVAVAGTEQISDLLNQMRAKAVEASDGGLDAASRSTIAEDLTSLKKQIGTIISSSEFNGVNLLKTGGGTVGALKSVQDGDGATAGYQADTLTVANTGLQATIEAAQGTGGTGGGLGAAGAAITLGTATAAAELVDDIDNIVTSVKTQLSTLGSTSRTVDAQLTFTSKLSDVVEAGIGNLVDADLAKESAKLQALQVKQQLGVQALSIANQAPQSIISLFR
ncbi:flagellin [Sphingorhabdus sp. M41]|uniref:flagellin n=1 Tax=Sphingorhabdus sp. M41 TaxID=1806885 RepID=UPI00078C4128|nr:flagellin [Sphingorhabdus sp. M41]AMO72602.1 flagellin [Sphingorhabdus sp. M41]